MVEREGEAMRDELTQVHKDPCCGFLKSSWLLTPLVILYDAVAGAAQRGRGFLGRSFR